MFMFFLIVALATYIFHLFYTPIPKGLTVFLGVPGAGKTTLCAHYARKFFRSKRCKKQGQSIFCNVPILGTKKIVPREDFGKVLIENGVVLVDEAGLEYCNRNYKTNFSEPESLAFAKKFRHFGLRMLFFSQDTDFDIVWLRLCNRAIIVEKSAIPFCIRLLYFEKRVRPDEQTHQFQAQWFSIPGGHHLVFSPLCWKYFDTYESEYLPSKEFEVWNTKTRFINENENKS